MEIALPSSAPVTRVLTISRPTKIAACLCPPLFDRRQDVRKHLALRLRTHVSFTVEADAHGARFEVAAAEHEHGVGFRGFGKLLPAASQQIAQDQDDLSRCFSVGLKTKADTRSGLGPKGAIDALEPQRLDGHPIDF